MLKKTGLSKKIDFYKEAGIYRTPYEIGKREGKYLFIGNKRCINFASNDYLGIASANRINHIVAEAFLKYGTSSSSSRLISGNYSIINKAEEIYAKHFGYEDAIFFPSGYQANLALISALFDKEDTILFDKHAHSSIIKGIILSGAAYFGFNHNSVPHLKKRLSRVKGASVITESLFSMDGDILNVAEMEVLKEKYGFFCIVDEAHAFGVLGEEGRGVARGVADIAIGTFGKAFGFFGAFVLMPRQVKDLLFNFSSPFMYSTAIPVAHAAASIRLLSIVSECDKERRHLVELSAMTRDRLNQEGFSFQGDAHIISIYIGDEKKSVKISKALLEKGIFLPAVRYPTVPMGKAILRISLTALHDEDDIECLIDSLKEVWFE